MAQSRDRCDSSASESLGSRCTGAVASEGGGTRVTAGNAVKTRGATELLENEDTRGLLESAREAGSITADELAAALDELDLDPAQIDDLYQALDELQVDVLAAEVVEDEVAVEEAREVSTDALQLFLKD